MSRYVLSYLIFFDFCKIQNCHPFFSEQNTQRANCSTGSVRLGDIRVVGNTAEGRVEVCINQAWGTVCNTNFDQEDAGTVCEITGGYLRNGT